MLSVLAQVRAGAPWDYVSDSLCVYAALQRCVSECVCLQWGHQASCLALSAVSPVPWQWVCNFSDIPYLQFISGPINQLRQKISLTTGMNLFPEKMSYGCYTVKISHWLLERGEKKWRRHMQAICTLSEALWLRTTRFNTGQTDQRDSFYGKRGANM